MDDLYNKLEQELLKIKTEEKILKNVKRVQVFSGASLMGKLTELKVPEDKCQDFLTFLLVDNKMFKVEVNKKSCDIVLDYRFTEKGFYMWTTERTSYISLLVCVSITFLGIGLFMFQMWPSKLKVLSTYFSYLCGGFIGFLAVLAVIRLILFSVTYFTHSPGIWLFPNLFADCGFVDSFIPLWAFHGESTKKAKVD